MEGPYRLINSLIAHDGPVRSLCLGPNGEVVSGCQADSPCIRRWSVIRDQQNLSIEEVGNNIFHDHWVTALTSLEPDANRSFFPQGCTITGCMDSKIRVFDPNGVLLATMTGHTKGVISFSWSSHTDAITSAAARNGPYLLSGSWDGTAGVWDMTVLVCVRQFGPHENGVHVLGLSNGLVATTSTGESVGGKPANFKLRIWDIGTGQCVGAPIQDHTGSIRSIQALPGICGFLTTGNDGMVVMRSVEGQSISSTFHPAQEDGSPPFVLDSCALRTAAGMDYVTCGEDGSVVVWSGAEQIQSIPHPTCVWTVLALPAGDASGGAGGDFITAGHDGVIRVFSRSETLASTPQAVQYQSEFIMEVDQAQQKKRRGPSSEEIAKAPKWDQRFNTPGTSENQVMVFNKDGALVAAQWNSGSWVIVGEVTGSGDGGNINGVWYDHVMPVEIETPNGIKNLKLGHNDTENPFVAAQRFIDQNDLGQHHLSQIADWISARSGRNVPTIGATDTGLEASSSSSPTAGSVGLGGSSGSGYGAPPAAPHSSNAAVVFNYTITAFAIFDDIPAAAKLLPKLRELDATVSNPHDKIASFEAIEATLQTLANTAFYHSSIITSDQAAVILKPALHWEPAHAFPFFDILRVMAVHPSGAAALSQQPLLHVFVEKLISILKSDPNANALPLAPVLTATRFCCNMFKIDDLRMIVWQDTLLISLIEACTSLQAAHANKLVRVAASRTAANIALFSASYGQFAHVLLGMHVLEALATYCAQALASEKEHPEVIFNTLRVIGTLVKHQANGMLPLLHTRQVGSLMQQVRTEWLLAGKLSDAAAGCLGEVMAQLS